MNGLPLAWRRFVEESKARATAKDPRAEVLAGLMPLKDTFLAAHNQNVVQVEVWQTVFQALEARLDQTMKDLGAQALAQPGMLFDARLHSAVLATKSEAPPGTVLAVLRQGYALAGSIQRLAEVQVSRGPEHGGVTLAPSQPPQAHAEADGVGIAANDHSDAVASTEPDEARHDGEEK